MRVTRPARLKVQGFTLVEVLVVLVIIGILAAILLPVFFRVREAGRTTVCSSNLHQIGLAMTLYASDHNSYYPEPGPLNRPQNTSCPWVSRIEPYVKTTHVFECPSGSDTPVGGTTYSPDYHTGCPAAQQIEQDDGSFKEMQYKGSYDIADLRPTPQSRLRDNSFHAPSNTGYVVDGRGEGAYKGKWGIIVNNVEFTYYGIQRHNGGSNVLFADMHIKWLNVDKVSDPNLWSLDGAK